MPQAEDSPSPEDAHIPGHHNCQKHRGTAPVTWRCTRYVAVHPIWGSTPDMGRCTRSEKVHCLRIGCSAPTHKNKRGTGTPNHSPPHPSMRSWALLVAGRARRPRHLHPGPLRHLPHPYMRRAGYRLFIVTVDRGNMLVVPRGDVRPMGCVLRMCHAAGIVEYPCFLSNLSV